MENGIKAKFNEFDEKLDSHHDKISKLFVAITGDISDPEKPGLKAQIGQINSNLKEWREFQIKDHDELMEVSKAVYSIGKKLDAKRKRSAVLYTVVATQAIALVSQFIFGS